MELVGVELLAFESYVYVAMLAACIVGTIGVGGILLIRKIRRYRRRKK